MLGMLLLLFCKIKINFLSCREKYFGDLWGPSDLFQVHEYASMSMSMHWG